MDTFTANFIVTIGAAVVLGKTTTLPIPFPIAGMNQAEGGRATAPVHPTIEPATAAAAVWPSAARSERLNTCSEKGFGGAADTTRSQSGPPKGSGAGAADSTRGQKGGANQEPASTSAVAAAEASDNLAAAAGAAVAAAVVATASAAAATVTAGAFRDDNASVAFSAGGAVEGEGAADSTLTAATPSAAVRTTSTSSGSDSSVGSVDCEASRAVEKGDQAPAGKPPRSLSAWLKEVCSWSDVLPCGCEGSASNVLLFLLLPVFLVAVIVVTCCGGHVCAMSPFASRTRPSHATLRLGIDVPTHVSLACLSRAHSCCPWRRVSLDFTPILEP